MLIQHSKYNCNISELTFLSTPKLLYVSEMDTVEFRMAHRVAHTHEHLEIIYVFEGSGSIIIEDKEYHVAQGDMVVYNSSTMHDEKPETSQLGIRCFGVGNLCLTQLPPNCLLPKSIEPVIPCGNMTPLVEYLFTEMFSLMDTPSESNEIICNHIMMVLLSIINELGKSYFHEAKGSSRASEICDQVKDFISKNYSNELSIDIISQAIAVSPYHMSRIFKKETKSSPMQYVTRLRLGKAQALLVHTTLSVTDIAFQVGYNNSSAFNYAFLKLFGISPENFRKIYIA